MNISALITGLYGLFTIIGGVIGYAKAHSMPSLIAGVVSGAILLICSYGLSQNNMVAAIIGLLVAIALGGRFFGTIIQNFKIMPDFIILVFSLLTIITILFVLFKK